MLRNHLRLAVDRSHPCQHLRARPQQTLTRRGWTLNLEFLRLRKALVCWCAGGLVGWWALARM